MAKRRRIRTPDSGAKPRGSLIIIGGREEKSEVGSILKEVVRHLHGGKLCVATVASTVGHELWEEYRKVFYLLGVKKITHLDVLHRHQAIDSEALKALDGASGVFFTGGDQLKITSELGGTVIADRIAEIYHKGGLIAGTSAGASVMSETMLVSGSSEATYRIGSGLRMAPGLGFVPNMIIDQHFAQRGRVARLIGAVAQNPKFLGVGIDENTAIIIEPNQAFRVIGAGAVYVLDARDATESNISEADQDAALSIFNVKFHLLSNGDEFSMSRREPIVHCERKSAA